MKPLHLIAAVASNGIIGRAGRLPWSLPLDWNHYLESTRGHVCIMGRRSFEDGAPPRHDCMTIVLTRDSAWRPPAGLPSIHRAAGLSEARILAEGMAGEIYICGGPAVYAEALPLAQAFILTRVLAAYEGDRRFPDGWETHFSLLSWERRARDRSVDLVFQRWDRAPQQASAGTGKE